MFLRTRTRRRPTVREGSVDDQPGYPLRMPHGVRDSHRGALATAQDGEFLQADGIDHFFKVLDRSFEGKIADVPVRKTTAALVIPHQGIVLHNFRQPLPPQRGLPLKIQVIEPMDGSHQHWSLSSDAVRDPHTVTRGEGLDPLIQGFGRFRNGFQLDQPSVLRQRSYLGNKSISVPWHGFDALRWEPFPELRDAIVQIVVFDDGVRPYGLHEGVFAHKLAGILHQHTKSVEQLAPQADFLVVTKQPSLIHVEEVIAKEIFGHAETGAALVGTGTRRSPTWLAILSADADASPIRRENRMRCDATMA